jgi:hypothetical protein
MTPLIAIATRLNACHPEAIRQGWLQDLNVNSGEHASPPAILSSGHLQVTILRDAAGTA